MANPYQRPCVDTNVFTYLLTGQPPDRAETCRLVFEGAEQGLYPIVASTLVAAEVLYWTGEDKQSVTDEGLAKIEAFTRRSFITWISVDLVVAEKTRALSRQFPVLKRPHDTVHLVTAILAGCDVLLTNNTKHLPEGVYDGVTVRRPYFPFDQPLPFAEKATAQGR